MTNRLKSGSDRYAAGSGWCPDADCARVGDRSILPDGTLCLLKRDPAPRRKSQQFQ